MTDPLLRIAAALERLSPPPPPAADPLAHPAYGWDGAVLSAARGFRPLPIERLVGIDAQRDALTTNLARLAAGAAEIATEAYCGIIMDRESQRPVFMVSPAGGIDIEEVAEKTPEKIMSHIDSAG